jgi:ABC-type Fe3+ transport system permease subunit
MDREVINSSTMADAAMSPGSLAPMQVWSAAAALRAISESMRATWQEMLTSLMAGSLASVLAVSATLPLAWRLHRRPREVPVWGFLMGFCLAIPGPVLGLALIKTFNHPGLLGAIYDSMWILVLAQALRVWPFVFLAVWAPVRLVPLAIFDAARVDGANSWQLFWRLQLPLSLPAAGLGFVVGLVLCVGELAASVLVQPPGTLPLSVHIFVFLHYGMERHLAGVTLVLVAATLILGVCLALVASRAAGRLTRASGPAA